MARVTTVVALIPGWVKEWTDVRNCKVENQGRTCKFKFEDEDITLGGGISWIVSTQTISSVASIAKKPAAVETPPDAGISEARQKRKERELAKRQMEKEAAEVAAGSENDLVEV